MIVFRREATTNNFVRPSTTVRNYSFFLLVTFSKWNLRFRSDSSRLRVDYPDKSEAGFKFGTSAEVVGKAEAKVGIDLYLEF